MIWGTVHGDDKHVMINDVAVDIIGSSVRHFKLKIEDNPESSLGLRLGTSFPLKDNEIHSI